MKKLEAPLKVPSPQLTVVRNTLNYITPLLHPFKIKGTKRKTEGTNCLLVPELERH